MNSSAFILCLGPHQVDDALFLQALARTLAKAGRSLPPTFILHGAGELAERRLEGEGLEATRRGGALVVETTREARIVALAARESNQKLVSVLSDAVVYAVGFQGTDRGLLRFEAGGRVSAGTTGWVQDLARKGAIPVISGVARDAGTGEPVEVGPARAAVALEEKLQEEVIVVFFSTSNRLGLPGEDGPLLEATVEQVEAGGVLPDVESLRRVTDAGITVLVAAVSSFWEGDAARGTRVVT